MEVILDTALYLKCTRSSFGCDRPCRFSQMFNANSEASAKFRQESELAFQLLSNRVADR